MCHSVKPVLLFAEPIPFEELCSIELYLPEAERTKFQAQVVKSRELIFTEPDILATPVLEQDKSVYVIMQKSLYKTSRIQVRLQRLGLEFSEPKVVPPSLFQECLNYTLLARIAPAWNKVGEWLIQGRNFLTNASYMNGINMQLVVHKDEVFISLEATAVKMTPMTTSDFDFPSCLSKDLMQNQNSEVQLPGLWCHVLPSMKQGKLVSMRSSLPKDGLFVSYKDIKRYWKNTYGYRLPETDENIFYYQVKFWPLGERLFTYPDICLRAKKLQKIPRINPEPIVCAFLKDVKSKMPYACGYQLNFQPKMQCAKPFFYEATQKQPERTLNLMQTISKVNYRPALSKTPAATSEKSEESLTKDVSQSLLDTTSDSTSKERVVPIFKSTIIKKLKKPEPQPVTSYKVVPTFKIKNCTLPHQVTLSELTTKKEGNHLVKAAGFSKSTETSYRKSTPHFSASSDSVNFKRKKTEFTDKKTKKLHTQPKPKESPDIDKLAKTGKLEKANVPFLLSWLKDRGISCKSKCKKAEIIQQVKAALNLTSPEE